MLEGKAKVQDTDMPVKMQIQAMASASEALDLYDVLDCKSIAAHIKKEFDKKYGGGWQCVAGSNFGCFFTHSKGSFIYFALETLNFLIFKSANSTYKTLRNFSTQVDLMIGKRQNSVFLIVWEQSRTRNKKQTNKAMK